MTSGADGPTTRRRRALAITALGCVVTTAAVWARPATASSPTPAWKPAARDLRHSDRWVLAGEAASRNLPRTHPQILFVGDSITQWWLRFAEPTWRADFASLGAVDDGVAGDTTSNVLARLNDGSLAGVHPRVVVVLVGTNNIPLGQSPADVARGVLVVVADLQARLRGVRVLLLAVLPRGDPGSAERRAVTAINRILAEQAPTTGATYLDLGQLLLTPRGYFLPGVMQPDLLHPASSGYERMAADLAPAVRRLLGEG